MRTSPAFAGQAGALGGVPASPPGNGWDLAGLAVGPRNPPTGGSSTNPISFGGGVCVFGGGGVWRRTSGCGDGLCLTLLESRKRVDVAEL